MDNNQLKITALNIDDATKLLEHSGSRYASADNIRKDIAAGAPVNPDGTINLITYAAWLVKETSDAD
jgi:hypothetical protein